MKIMLLNILVSLSATMVFAATPTKTKLALNWKAEPQFGGFYTAQINGEFKKRGLDVEILEGGSGTPTVQMLGANKVDYAIVSAEEIILAQDRGSKIVGLFATYQTNPQAIMTHEARGFKTLKDVFASEGVLSVQSGLSYAQFLLKKYPQPKVKVVPYLGGITNFVKDPQYSQQCFFTSEPLLAEKAGLKTKTFLVSEEGFNPYTTVVAVSAETLKKDPKTSKAMIDAIRAGWEEYLKNPEPTNKHMAGINKSMDAETFAKSATAQKSLIETTETKQKGLGFMSEQRWQDLITQLKDLKIIKKSLNPKDLYQAM
ncbi:ABC transporter substrate-binding protein [Bdellovibrio sp. HCB337]|uniref:ABC transporter substrate-binding protein n=1 Tax=Bdellovibrio sp. HCB337 TaxID=3394358 RepID=UPI0039A55240